MIEFLLALFRQNPLTGYIPKYFDAPEFLDQKTHKYMANKQIDFWLVMDARILWTMDQLRMRYDSPIYINTWYGNISIDDRFQWRGFRPAECEIGAKFSQHRKGSAVDFDVEGMSSMEVRGDIVRGKQKNKHFTQYITAIEKAVNWNHIDCRNRFQNEGLLIF